MTTEARTTGYTSSTTIEEAQAQVMAAWHVSAREAAQVLLLQHGYFGPEARAAARAALAKMDMLPHVRAGIESYLPL